jgi:hypothetical protein
VDAPEVKLKSASFTLTAPLIFASVLLLFMFLTRLVRMLERPDLERKARWIVRFIACLIGLIGMDLSIYLVRIHKPDLFPEAANTLMLLLSGIPFVICAAASFIHSFGLIRGLQQEIMQRL